MAVASRQFHGDLGHSLEYMLNVLIIFFFFTGKGHFGELARSKTMGAPIKTNEEGRQRMNEERNIETVT
jgi:hypothetical protein